MGKPTLSGFTRRDDAANPTAEGEVTRNSGTVKRTLHQDIGYPGTGKEMVVGEGGAYKNNLAGTEVVKAYTYDASAASGSRFSAALTLDAQNTWLGAAGDRFYVGSPNKFWAARFAVGVAKTAEVLEMYYWNGALTQAYYMGILKDSNSSLGEAVLEQTSEKEYAVFCDNMDADWAAVDNQLDEIPNTGTALYWVCFQVPAGGLATPPRIDEIRVHGSEFKVHAVGAPIMRGKGRYAVHDRLPIYLFTSPAGTPVDTLVITGTQGQQVYDFRTNLNDEASTSWKITHGVDTSCPIIIELDYAADAAINTADILLDIKKLQNGTDIGGGEASDYSQTTNINVAAGNKTYLNEDLTTTMFHINDLVEDDLLSLLIRRTDNNGNHFYPIILSVHYVMWRLGQQI